MSQQSVTQSSFFVITYVLLLLYFGWSMLLDDRISANELLSREQIADGAYMQGLLEGKAGAQTESFNEGKTWGYREACMRCCELEDEPLVPFFDPVTGACACMSRVEAHQRGHELGLEHVIP